MPPILVPSSTKRIATQMLVPEKLNGRKEFCFERLCLRYHPSHQKTTCSKLATQEQELDVKTVED